MKLLMRGRTKKEKKKEAEEEMNKELIKTNRFKRLLKIKNSLLEILLSRTTHKNSLTIITSHSQSHNHLHKK